MIFLDFIYFILVIILLPFSLKRIANREKRDFLLRRLGKNINKIKSEKKIIWFHGVSVGEIRAVRSLIKDLSEEYEVVVTVATFSGWKQAKEIYMDNIVLPAPFAFSFVVRKFINYVNPCLLVLSELELWPNYLILLKKKGVKALVINGRMSDKAYDNYKKFIFFSKRIFSLVNHFSLQGINYENKFLNLGVEKQKISITGNIKADEAFTASKEILKRKGKSSVNSTAMITIILASSHIEDEQVILPLMSKLKNYRWIIAPRHVERASMIYDKLQKEGIGCLLYSQNNKTSDFKNLIVDKMGVLMELISQSKIVIMGGTFNPLIGGHNFFEPAALNKIIFSGPFYNNFSDIALSLIEKNSLSVFENLENLEKLILNVDFNNCKSEEVNNLYRGSKEKIIKLIKNEIH